MEIHSLKVVITEQDLNDLVQKHWPEDQPVENVQVRVGPEGVTVKGVYPLFINVSFETMWALGVEAGRISARLSGLRAMGIPGNVFKSAILKLIADAARKEPWVQVDKEQVWLDVDGLLRKEGVTARTNLTGIICQAGQIMVEAAQRTP
jgi:hypothetical protein